MGSVLVGGLFAWVATKFQKVTIATVAGWFGYVFGILISFTALQNATDLAQWSVIVPSILTMSITAFCLDKEAVILSTALVGSYFVIRGISVYAGGFPNEYMFIRQMRQASLYDWQSASLYLYLSSIVVLTALTTWAQSKIYQKHKGGHLEPYELM